MKRLLMFVSCLILAGTVATSHAQAQSIHWIVGGNTLLSIASGGGGSSAGFTFGPMSEIIFNKSLAVGTEFNINTQAGTPIEWALYFKYYFPVVGSKIKPYADGGFGLLFLTGGPYFGIRFGGGAAFPIPGAKGLYIGPDLQLGPVFATGTTIFFILIRAGIRYDIQ